MTPGGPDAPAAGGLPPLALYVHVPWCVRKCPYCDFNSHPAPGGVPDAEFLAALLDDLEVDAPFARGRPLESVYLGGGTPSLLAPETVGRLLAGVSRHLRLAPGAEVTLEANPGTVDRVRLAELRDAGVNRLSLGVQSFDDELLGRIGRIHDRRQAVDGAEAAHAAGFGRLNLDLMYGLPGQSAEGAVRDLRTALSLGAGHLSWYQLTLERGTAFHRCPPVLPGEEEVDRTEAGGWALLAAAGLERYEVSAYALSGQRCRHNLGYWTFGDYLGVGPGAHGKLSHALPSDVSRRVKPRDPSSYLARPTGAERWRVGPEDLHAEFLLNALRLTEGVPSGLYAARTGLSPETLAPRVAEARRRGLMDRDPGYLRPSALGLRFLDDLLVLLTAEGGQTREA